MQLPINVSVQRERREAAEGKKGERKKNVVGAEMFSLWVWPTAGGGLTWYVCVCLEVGAAAAIRFCDPAAPSSSRI